MPLASVLPQLTALPLHVQLMLGIVVGSGCACLAVAGGGALVSHLYYRQRGLPPLPQPAFPGTGDQLFTAAFMLFILWGAASSMLPGREEAAGTSAAPLGWGTLLLALISQLALYLPMLVRYAVVHPWQRPTRPWQDYIRLPLLVWGGIYFSILLLEVSGLTPWLIRATNCPEHQDLVLLFSRGDMMQRLYIIIAAVIIAPVAEECCFRGFLYTTLRHWGGRMAATLASALLFAAIHGSLAQLIPLTLFGLAQCLAYEKARSLWLPISVHMLFNTTSLIATALMLP